MAVIITTLISLALAGVDASPTNPSKRATTPQVSSIAYQGIATDVYLNRDSCTSALVDYRALWTCRDTQASNGGFFTSSASWSNYTNGTPDFEFGQLNLYGDNTGNFYPIPSDECGPDGNCGDGSRYALWPDSPVLPYQLPDASFNFYTWIRNERIKGLTGEIAQPSTALYRGNFATSDGIGSNLPSNEILDETFWAEGAIPFGDYGHAISPNGQRAYLYGQLYNSDGSTNGVAVAKVMLDSIEDQSQYLYWNGAEWSATAPAINDTSAALQGFGNQGQGTFYYSSYFESYVWIGAPYIGDNAVFLISTATSPQGPWTTPTQFFNGPVGNNSGGLVAYSQQAHPGLSAGFGSGNNIYISYTKVDSPSDNPQYSTPVYLVTWQ